MADNKLILINQSQSNVLTDDQLIATDWDDDGIAVNEIAYSNRLNALLRQVTTVTSSIGGLVADELNLNIGSYDDAPNLTVTVTQARIKDTIEDIALEVAVDKNAVRNANIILAGPATGTAASPTFRSLVAADIPALDAAKITSGTFATARIADLAITTDKLAANAVTTAKISDDNVTFAKLQNSAAGLSVIGRGTNTEGDFLELTAATDNHVLRRSGNTVGFGTIATAGIADSAVTAAKLAGSAVETAKIKDENVSLAKLSRADILNTNGTKILDSLISDKHSSVIGYAGTGTNLANYILRVVSSSEYDALLTKEANTIYIIKD
jgi:hypothetical protein